MRPWACRVVGRRHARACLSGAICAGAYLVAGPPPLCRPVAVYRVTSAGRTGVGLRVVHAPRSPRTVGRFCWWGRRRLDAAWRLGDLRVVARWQAPTETLRASRDRRLREGAPAEPTAVVQVAIAAGG